MTDDIKCSDHAEHKLENFTETLISNTPRAINEEHQVGFSTSAYYII